MISILFLMGAPMFKIIICILAGLGAGLGTGFAGITLPRSSVNAYHLFTYGSYLAVGIALASDVLASAASATYGKNKTSISKTALS